MQAIVGEKSDTVSYGIRSDHLTGCINLFLANFPFGCGFGNIDMFYNAFTYEQGLSIGTMYYLAEGGIGGFLICVIPAMLALIKAFSAKDWLYVAFLIVFEWLLFVTCIVDALLIAWFVMALLIIRYPDMAFQNNIPQCKERTTNLGGAESENSLYRNALSWN